MGFLSWTPMARSSGSTSAMRRCGVTPRCSISYEVLPVRKVVSFAMVALVAVCASCGRTTIYPVSGKVTYKGSPASGAAVFFYRQGADSVNEPAIMGIVQDDGSFELVCGSLGKGAPARRLRCRDRVENTGSARGKAGPSAGLTNSRGALPILNNHCCTPRLRPKRMSCRLLSSGIRHKQIPRGGSGIERTSLEPQCFFAKLPETRFDVVVHIHAWSPVSSTVSGRPN